MHDTPAADDGTKYATGHFQLRQGAAKSDKVLYVWDWAGIDFRQWHLWQHTGALYFLRREKENMQLAPIGENAWDRADPRNAGVLADELVATSQGVSVRRVRYHCVLRGEEFSFLTSEYTLPPGVIAHLYRLRWEIEKTFDELKNKLGESKAWASAANAKAMQAHFLCLAHNLMILCEADLARVHGVRNDAELTRRATTGERSAAPGPGKRAPAAARAHAPAPHGALGKVHPLVAGCNSFSSLTTRLPSPPCATSMPLCKPNFGHRCLPLSSYPHKVGFLPLPTSAAR